MFNDTIDYGHRHLTGEEMDQLFSTVKDPQRIKNFQINSNQLLTLPSQIDRFQSLVTMELSNNQLVQLPHEISRLTNLKNLYLKNNALDDLSLPKELQLLKHLEVINLGGNRFKQFPYQLFHMISLREVYLGSNQIAFLPDLFHTLTKYVEKQVVPTRSSTLSLFHSEWKFFISAEIKSEMFQIRSGR